MPTLLVTGVSRDLGARFARTMAAEDTFKVIGVDVVPPRHDLGHVRFIRADIRNPVIAKIITAHEVDTVAHLAMVVSPTGAGGRSSMKEINVIGTMQLLAACQKAEKFAKLVVQSSVSVYGASPRDPAKFTEDLTPQVQPRTGFGKDSVEIEGYVRGLARRRPDVTVTTLRLANLMGAGVDSQVARYLSLPVVPRVAGFDARLQFLHPTDAVEALRLAVLHDLPGTYNVAAPDVVTLSQALRMLGRPSLGLPAGLAPAVAGLARQARFGDFTTDQVAALTYGRAMDASRYGAVSGFTPHYSSREALAEFVATSKPGPLAADRLAALLGGAAGARSASGRRDG